MKRTFVLATAALATALGLGATQANAAQFGVYVGVRPAPVYAQPPCPGAGYEWAAGYWNAGYWVPGRWNFVGVHGGYDGRVVARDRDWGRDRYVQVERRDGTGYGRGDNRGFDRGGYGHR